ncbi:hypothetical protein B0537_10080 [Desulforamulus ferrireducens]|uniref:Uncharacterized protein n=1 Tax=Desulforamulus ferrireducens TaxID=1833852 RepID=A0A1S6IXA3_9FIRM|nr:hypothetical protein B0537_10080 [Desulforamulus ferrireducens]
MDIFGFNDSLFMHLIPRTIIFVIVVLTFLPWFFRWLWNTTMPEVFNLKPITYGQSFKLLLMSWILFGLFGD